MKKAEEARREIEEIRKDFEKESFEKLYSYIENIIDEQKSIGWLYTYKKIPVDSLIISDKLYNVIEGFNKLPEFEDAYFLKLDNTGNFKPECFDEELKQCVEKLNEKLEQDGWKLHYNESWQVNPDEEYTGYISFFE